MNEKELIKACENNISEEVKSLIEKGVDINLEYDYWTPLTKASEKGHFNIVQYLVENGAEIDKENGYGWTPLMCASMNGFLDIVKYLVDKGANIEIKTDSKWTALTFASTEGHLEVVKYLIKSGADVNVRDDKNRSIIDCILNGASDVDDALLSDKHLKIIEILKENGVDFGNYKKSSGGMKFESMDITENKDNTITISKKGEQHLKYNKEDIKKFFKNIDDKFSNEV